jgi:hypothetical protein
MNEYGEASVIEINRFTELVPKARLAGLVNGCGPLGLGLLVPDFEYKDLCNLHDLCYSLGFRADIKPVLDSWLILRLQDADAPEWVLETAALGLLNTDFLPRRPLGPFLSLDRGKLTLFRYRLFSDILQEVSSLSMKQGIVPVL